MNPLKGNSNEHSPHQPDSKTVCQEIVAQFNHASQRYVLVVIQIGYTSSSVYIIIGCLMYTNASVHLIEFVVQSGISEQEICLAEVVGGSNLRCA